LIGAILAASVEEILILVVFLSAVRDTILVNGKLRLARLLVYDSIMTYLATHFL